MKRKFTKTETRHAPNPARKKLENILRPSNGKVEITPTKERQLIRKNFGSESLGKMRLNHQRELIKKILMGEAKKLYQSPENSDNEEETPSESVIVNDKAVENYTRLLNEAMRKNQQEAAQLALEVAFLRSVQESETKRSPKENKDERVSMEVETTLNLSSDFGNKPSRKDQRFFKPIEKSRHGAAAARAAGKSTPTHKNEKHFKSTKNRNRRRSF